MKRIAVLGSTGSIGTQALEIINSRDDLQAIGIAAGKNWREAVLQARGARALYLAIAD